MDVWILRCHECLHTAVFHDGPPPPPAYTRAARNVMPRTARLYDQERQQALRDANTRSRETSLLGEHQLSMASRFDTCEIDFYFCIKCGSTYQGFPLKLTTREHERWTRTNRSWSSRVWQWLRQ